MYYVSLIIIALIFIWRIVVGFRKGMVKEIGSLIAMAVAGVCIFLIIGAVRGYLDNETGKLIQNILILFAVCVIYRLLRVLATSIQLVSKLPIIKILDKLLGLVVGCAEAVLIVGFVVYFLKNWGLSILALSI